MNIDYLKEEKEYVKKLFDLEEIINFPHNLEIIRGEDWQYVCYINNQGYSSALTPMGALIMGIKAFNKLNQEDLKINKNKTNARSISKPGTAKLAKGKGFD